MIELPYLTFRTRTQCAVSDAVLLLSAAQALALGRGEPLTTDAAGALFMLTDELTPAALVRDAAEYGLRPGAQSVLSITAERGREGWTGAPFANVDPGTLLVHRTRWRA